VEEKKKNIWGEAGGEGSASNPRDPAIRRKKKKGEPVNMTDAKSKFDSIVKNDPDESGGKRARGFTKVRRGKKKKKRGVREKRWNFSENVRQGEKGRGRGTRKKRAVSRRPMRKRNKYKNENVTQVKGR